MEKQKQTASVQEHIELFERVDSLLSSHVELPEKANKYK